MELIRVKPIDEGGSFECQVNEFGDHDGGDNWTNQAVVIGQFFPIAGGAVELRLCARCWRKLLDDQRDSDGWMYHPLPCQCCVNAECDCQPDDD